MGMKSSEGQIVQVEGGHIIRSTGRKDRHSKVYTAKGPRDRRVRLAAHTAIQFYDVQDRLGYDRPSKAVDWLINKAKNAIDKLEELPPWNPMDTTMLNPNQNSNIGLQQQQQSEHYAFQQMGNNPIDDTMKSFFPTSSGMNYHNYQGGDIISRGSTQSDSQDLCLSLQSLQDLNNSGHPTPTHDQHELYSGPSPEANYAGWDGEMKHGYYNLINSQTMPQPEMICETSTPIFSQREPLQSSFSPYVRAWNDLPFPVSDHNNSQAIHHFSISSSQFGSEKYSGFQVPARIHGEDPSSGSTKSHN